MCFVIGNKKKYQMDYRFHREQLNEIKKIECRVLWSPSSPPHRNWSPTITLQTTANDEYYTPRWCHVQYIESQSPNTVTNQRSDGWLFFEALQFLKLNSPCPLKRETNFVVKHVTNYSQSSASAIFVDTLRFHCGHIQWWVYQLVVGPSGIIYQSASLPRLNV